MRYGLKLLATLSESLVLLAISGLAPAAAETKPYRNLASDALLTMEGVWRSRGYGWWWVIKNGRITSFDAGTAYCQRRRQYWGLPGHAGDEIKLSADGRTVRLVLGDSTYRYTFDKVKALPPACQTNGNDEPVAVFDAAVSILSEHYAFFRERQIDWAQHVKTRRRGINNNMSEVRLFSELAALIAPIDDGHVGIEAYFSGRRRQYEPPQKSRPLPSNALKRRQQIGYWTKGIGAELVGDDIESIGDGRIKYGLIGGDVGYLYVGSTGRSLRRALAGPLDEAKELFRGARGLIIDLTRNFGGADHVARRFASRFTRERTLGYYKAAGDAQQAEPQPAYIEPSKDLLFDGPILVITGASTISAAEILVMCLRALPNVTHIGAATRGSLSDILEKRLPNDWELSLSNEVYFDHKRTAWEGRGIKPHIAFDVQRSNGDTAEAKAAARRMIKYLLEAPTRLRIRDKERS